MLNPLSTQTQHRVKRVHYDPKFRVQLLDALMDHLSKRHNELFQHLVDETALAHNQLTNTARGFLYKGKTYSHSLEHVSYFHFIPLHDSLIESFASHANNHVDSNKRLHSIRGALVRLLSVIGNMNDLREILPESIHSQLPANEDEVPFLSDQELHFFREQNAEAIKRINYQLLMQSIEV